MEPEIGLLMCSLVGLSPNRSCFDPFCGSGALLAYAKVHGADVTVGMDVAMDANHLLKVMDNFGHYGVEPPSSMLQGNVEDCLHPASSTYDGLLSPQSFDFIVTDPPYGMRENIVMGTHHTVYYVVFFTLGN